MSLQAAVNLYVSTLQKWKSEAENSKVQIGQVSAGKVYVGGQEKEFASVSPGYVSNDQYVYVAKTENDNEVVVLG